MMEDGQNSSLWNDMEEYLEVINELEQKKSNKRSTNPNYSVLNKYLKCKHVSKMSGTSDFEYIEDSETKLIIKTCSCQDVQDIGCRYHNIRKS